VRWIEINSASCDDNPNSLAIEKEAGYANEVLTCANAPLLLFLLGLCPLEANTRQPREERRTLAG
jgi:hypothetical protein